jgi:hypothetical protein
MTGFNALLNKSQSDIVGKQLIELLAEVDRAIQSGDLKYIEEVYAHVLRAIGLAGTQIYDPLFVQEYAVTGTVPDPDHYNRVFDTLIKDMFTVFEELKYTGDIVVSNYNRLVNEELALEVWTKKIYNKVSDLTLFSTDVVGRSTYVSDDFVNYDNVDFEKRFLQGSMCFVDTVQGLVTLPRTATASALVVTETKINRESNGQEGNSQQLNTAPHDNILEILDDNSDTWWEYERVAMGTQATPLILSLTLTLSSRSIVNHVRINPNNLGTSNWVKVLSIETSVDDAVYTSIRESLDTEGFGDLLIDEDFILAPSNSKYAGQGMFSFTPRKAKYVRIIMEQSQGYWIDTTAGRRFRYAVGIRDIEISSIGYQQAGTIVSLPFSFSEEIRKVAIVAVENPVRESTLAKIEHYISVDDGATWKQLQRIGGEDPDLPKIININSGDETGINTTNPTDEIRHKAVLVRLSDGFGDEKAATQEELVEIYDLRQIPTGAPYQFLLSQRPVSGSLSIINPIFGSKGWTSPRLYVGTSDGTADQEFYLDIATREDEERLFVNSQLWERVEDFSDEFQYVLNYNTGLVKFGNSQSIPTNNALITIELPAERVVIEGARPHTFTLENWSDGDKNAVEIVRFETQKKVVGEIVHPNASVIYMAHPYVDDVVGVEINEPGSPKFIAEETFVDGVTELSVLGDYSIDYTNGIIHLKGLTWATGKTTLNYTYTPIVTIAPDLYSFVEGTNFQGIEIDHDAFFSIKVEDENTDSQQGQRVIALLHETVVRGTLSFNGNAADQFRIEIPFVDGLSEFSDIVDVEDESVPVGSNEFFLNHMAYSTDDTRDTALPVRFSDTSVFASELDWGEPLGAGEYAIDYETNYDPLETVQAKVKTGTVTAGGTVDYKYQDSARAASLLGSYSIDYREGIIYINLSEAMADGSSVNYEYANYAVKYRIAKELDNTQYTVSPDDRQVTILDPMVLEDYLPTTRQAGLVKVYYKYVEQIRESIEELEPYFTPVLNGYALKIITSSLL